MRLSDACREKCFGTPPAGPRDRDRFFIVRRKPIRITSEAFNALPKLLEEPAGVGGLVLRCTTESHKIPTTIASRPASNSLFRVVRLFANWSARMVVDHQTGRY